MLEILRRLLAQQQTSLPSDSKKHRGAVAVLIKEEAEDLWVLMMRRRDNPLDPWSGQMAFPGGHAEPQDRSLFETVARETVEEVGIDVRSEVFLGCLGNVEPKNAPMIVTPFVFLLTGEVHPNTSREAQEILWIPVSFLLNPRNTSAISVQVGDKTIPMGCYRYSNHIVWGMSFRIVRQLISKITHES